MEDSESERLPTFVKGLDERLEGGIPRGFAVLISGKSGSMKSSLAFYMLHNLATERDLPVLYLTLEQRKELLLRHMSKLGMDHRKARSLTVLDMRQFRKRWSETQRIDWMTAILEGVEHHRKENGCEAVAIDSLDSLYTLSRLQRSPRNRLFGFVDGLRDMDITSYLVSEIWDEGDRFGFVSFLVDGIIHLDLVREGKLLNLQLGVPKMRETHHARRYFPLIVDETGFRIIAKE